MKKLVFLCSMLVMFCVVVKAQNISASSQVKDAVTPNITNPAKANADVVMPITYNLTVQNNTGGGTFQFQLVPQFSGGTSASFNFTTSQTISVVAGVYNIYMRGPGSNYTFAYQVCATFGNVTGPNATFNNVNICSNGVVSVN
ncbi:hypothetical protein [Mucilaginibacter sp. MD40]|uniref:hypothetical protein n=1 Tax=Mucilaginibacter sp. MD40 TaxID=2029590 RepID=UPI00117ED293|nr:hypothetical protein [Mucilaginibacter sp. MD40]